MIFSHDKLKKDRLSLMSQEDIADATGISLSVIKNIECGRKKITLDSAELLKICSVLELTPEDYFVRNTNIISFFSNKGGSGKTTTCANLGYVLNKEYGLRVLMIDVDQQQNLSKHYGQLNNPYADEKNIYNAFINQESIKKHIINTGYDGLDIVISHYNVGKIEVMLPTTSYREQKFSNILEEVKNEGYYDLILLDLNPSFSMLNHIVLCATNAVIIPLEATAFGLGGIDNVIEFVKRIQEESYKSGKHKLEILGVVISKFDRRLKMSEAIANVAGQLFDENGYMFNSRIGLDASVGKCQVEELPLGVNYSKTNAYIALKELGKEVIERVQKL